jgi:hypothetical protein
VALPDDAVDGHGVQDWAGQHVAAVNRAVQTADFGSYTAAYAEQPDDQIEAAARMTVRFE